MLNIHWGSVYRSWSRNAMIGPRLSFHVPHKRKEKNDEDGRFGERQHDLPEGTQWSGAVDGCRIFKLEGQPLEKLPVDNEQNTAPNTITQVGWDEQRQIGIHPLQLGKEHELRNHYHLRWYDDREQQQAKQNPAPAKGQASKTVAHQRTHQRLPNGGKGAGHNADRQRTKIIQMLQSQYVTVSRWIARNPAHRRVAELDQRFERCGKHEEHRKQKNIRQLQQDQPAQYGKKNFV